MLKCVITGGPCAGKTQIMNYLTQTLEERGYHVFIVPETPTELILNGIRPGKHISMEDFQNFVLDKQLAKEELYNELTKFYDEDKIVIFYDRGIMDACAYVDKDTFFEGLLRKRGLSFASVFARYDAVIHLVTTADGAEQFYQWNDPSKSSEGNNAARSESPAEAREKDKKTLNAWVGHPHLRIIDNSTDFIGKINNTEKEIFSVLGASTPKEVERKFLIKKPTKAELDSLGCVSETNIIQTYLVNANDKSERRIRQRGTESDGYTFYYSEKTDIGLGERYETGRRLSQSEYIMMLAEADTHFHQISKVRRCFVYDKRHFELDIYPFNDEYAILEIELNDINEFVNFPPLTFIKEVTNDVNYRNHSIAVSLSFPDISADPKPEEPAKPVWIYETGKEEPEILGSGSTYYNIKKTKSEEQAFIDYKEDRQDYLIRFRFENKKRISQWYDCGQKEWIDD